MGGRIDTILMCVKFGDDRISSLDFSFIGGGVPLRTKKVFFESVKNILVLNVAFSKSVLVLIKNECISFSLFSLFSLQKWLKGHDCFIKIPSALVDVH